MKILRCPLVCWMAMVVCTGSVCAQQHTPDNPKAPDALRPPASQVLLMHLIGKGKQIYVCQNTAGRYAWKLKAPAAQLFEENGEAAGRHFAGPTWEAHDGSRVVAKVAESVPAPASGSIPWLLLTAVSHEGKGTMNQVQSVQRLNTRGGSAPEASCDAANATHEIEVPYQADYYFYGTPR